MIYEDSPYFAGTGAASNWLVDHELGAQPPARAPQAFFAGSNTSPNISNDYEAAWLPRGFGVVHSESPGTGHSDGCPTSGGPNETLAATAVIDWLNGDADAFTTRTGAVLAAPVDWHNGRTAMIGASYNGTLPIAAAATGVDGLAAIVPVSAISDWYGYYRANGLVRAPHSDEGGTGNNAFQGEDLDVLADAVYSRRDEGNPRTICRPVIDALKAQVARDSGDRTAVWRERAYDLTKIKAATLIAHGGDDFNVMTEQAARLYATLRCSRHAPRVLFPSGRPRRRPARLPAQPVVHEVPVEPGQRRREPGPLVGRARVGVLPAARHDGHRRGLEHRGVDGREHGAVPVGRS